MVTQAAPAEERSRRHLLDVAGLDWRSLQKLLTSREGNLSDCDKKH